MSNVKASQTQSYPIEDRPKKSKIKEKAEKFSVQDKVGTRQWVGKCSGIRYTRYVCYHMLVKGNDG